MDCTEGQIVRWNEEAVGWICSDDIDSVLSEDEVNALEGGDMVFRLGNNAIPFRNEGFIQSFSLPNFYFHATTTYDILRHLGAPLGKRDFLGQMRVNM